MNSETEISENFVNVPGGEIYVKRWKPELTTDKTPLILLHDSLGCTEMWRDFPLRLCEATGREVISYDRLGFGRSTKRNELPSVRFVSEEGEIYLPAILKALRIEKFALFGHSVGGAMAVVAAGTLKQNCTAIITESAQVFVEDRTRAGISKAKTDFADPKVFGKLEKYHGEKSKWVFDAWTEVWLSEGFASWNLKNDLPKVQCPVLAIHGDKDEYGSTKFPEVITELAGGPAQKEIIADCGHVPHREKPDMILNLVAKFFTKTKN